MSGNRPFLTISLLSSGRAGTIERCLSSLAPLKEQLDAEIIVVDTDPGHREDVFCILEKYADKIIPFEWCDDFAAARNAGLERARGEWFMFIDDDEWFMDVDDIIAFFRSGEYRGYRCASYRIRDYADFSGQDYRDEWILRMVKREDATRFLGRIHEYLHPVTEPHKLLRSTVEHYGYVFDSEKKHLAHAWRNISLLLEMVREEPDNVRWQYQLALEYKAIGLTADKERICHSGLALLDGKTDSYEVNIRGFFVAELLTATYNANDWEALARQYEQRGKWGAVGQVAEAYCAMLASVGYLELKKYGRASGLCRSYRMSYEVVSGNEEAFADELQMSLADTFSDKYRIMAAAVWIEAEAAQHRWEVFDRYFEELGWEDGAPCVYHLFAARMLERIAAEDCIPQSAAMLAAFLQAGWARNEVCRFYEKLSESGDNDFWRLTHCLSETDSGHYLALTGRLLWADYLEDDLFAYTELYEKLFDGVVDVFSLDMRLWDMAWRRKVDIEALFSGVPFDVVHFGIERFLEGKGGKMPSEKLGGLIEAMEHFSRRGDERLSYFTLRAREAYLIRWEREQEDGIPQEADSITAQYAWLRQELMRFCRDCRAFYSRYYTKDAFAENAVFLPEACRMANRLLPALGTGEQSAAEVLSGLKGSLKWDEPFDGVIVYFTHLYGEYVKNKQQPADEMRQLIDRLQQKVEELIAAGMTDEAEEIIKEIERVRR